MAKIRAKWHISAAATACTCSRTLAETKPKADFFWEKTPIAFGAALAEATLLSNQCKDIAHSALYALSITMMLRNGVESRVFPDINESVLATQTHSFKGGSH